jgi:hypothetical protein
MNEQWLYSRELRAHVVLGPDPRKIEILGPGPRKMKNLGPSPTRVRSSADPGPSGPRPGVFFNNIQHPVCTWIYRDHGLTTYNWLSRENNRYTIISWCLLLSINAPKIKSCHSVEKSRTKMLYVDFSSIVYKF